MNIKPRARFKYDELNIFRELSENLYPDYLSSIRELGIQNPFDVDATISRIDLDPEKRMISFSDNGSGMSSGIINNHFLTIGFSSKKRGERTKGRGRKIIGNKGIGRLSWQKLGQRAEVFTETESEAHLIKMNRHSMEVEVRKVPKQGKCGTRWNITETFEGMNVESTGSFIREKAGLLLRLNPDFHIIVNGKRVKPKIMEGNIIKLISEKHDSSLILSTEMKKVTISARGIVVDEIDLYGLGGYIDSDLFRETSDRERALKDRDFNDVISEVRSDLLDILLQMNSNRGLYIKYRENLIRVSTHLDIKTALKRKKLSLMIPVYVQGRGWTELSKVRELAKMSSDQNTFIEISGDGKGTKRSERAVDLGYVVVLARSPLEAQMVRTSINARKIDEIPMEILSSKGIAIEDARFSGILENAAEILAILSDITIDMTDKPSKCSISASSSPIEFQPAKRKIVPPPARPEPMFEVDVEEHTHIMNINGTGILLCQMDNDEIIALADPVHRRIFLNTRSTLIDVMKDRPMEDQRVLLLDEICHEMAHILGFGLRVHDERFFKVHRYLKYRAMRQMFDDRNRSDT
ncbi:MAG: ATP-binding protein [Candidatus Thermoplasmatota archaeon]|nr:ATP-binding protein [Candidatus Thermoplasmatota archaeon]